MKLIGYGQDRASKPAGPPQVHSTLILVKGFSAY